MSKIKTVKNLVSSLDINTLYLIQSYLSNSQIFFSELEKYINDYGVSLNNESEYDFTKKVINLYNHLKDDLKID